MLGAECAIVSTGTNAASHTHLSSEFPSVTFHLVTTPASTLSVFTAKITWADAYTFRMPSHTNHRPSIVRRMPCPLILSTYNQLLRSRRIVVSSYRLFFRFLFICYLASPFRVSDVVMTLPTLFFIVNSAASSDQNAQKML